MASVIWLLSFIGFELLLVAGACLVAFASSVTLAEELVEWRRHKRSIVGPRTIAAACLLTGEPLMRLVASVDEEYRTWRA
jgi:hypothetical protein